MGSLAIIIYWIWWCIHRLICRHCRPTRLFAAIRNSISKNNNKEATCINTDKYNQGRKQIFFRRLHWNETPKGSTGWGVRVDVPWPSQLDGYRKASSATQRSPGRARPQTPLWQCLSVTECFPWTENPIFHTSVDKDYLRCTDTMKYCLKVWQ